MFSGLTYLVYLGLLCIFSFVSHPVFYCVLLVLSALAASAQAVYIVGFSWYSALLCLIYIGGVYILFIFVSAHSPNTNSLPQVSTVGWLSVFFIATLGLWGLSWSILGCVEASEFLCTGAEGVTYLVLGGTLLFGFLILSSITSIKDCYYR